VRKDPGGRLRVCLVYPNTYATGMANLGFQTLYSLFNRIDGCVCERAFLPGREDIAEYARTGARLFSYESMAPLTDFDVIAFSVSFEPDYLNIPVILGLAGIPLLREERDRTHPLVMAGGVAVSLNPEPVSEFFDLFMIGEAEGATERLVEALAASEATETPEKQQLVEGLSSLEGVYVPSLFEFSYDGARIASMTPVRSAEVRAVKNMDLDRFAVPESFITAPGTGLNGAYLAEIERGCPRGCRFCAAGFLYLPPRWRDEEKIREAVSRGVERTGKVGLVGTAVSEHPGIRGVISHGISEGGSMTLSSLRMEVLDASLARLMKESGYTTLTLAPEAGTERLRAVVNKGISDDDVTEAVRMAVDAGFERIKLYFLVGLPTETDADARAIAGLAAAVRGIMKRGRLTLSLNPFVPKPFTPFQWHAFEKAGVIDKRIEIIKKAFARDPGVALKALGAGEALFQAYLSRADRRAGRIIEEAASNGWKRTLKAHARFIEESVYDERPRECVFPWEAIDHGVEREYLWREYRSGLAARLTVPCEPAACRRCGVC